MWTELDNPSPILIMKGEGLNGRDLDSWFLRISTFQIDLLLLKNSNSIFCWYSQADLNFFGKATTRIASIILKEKNNWMT